MCLAVYIASDKPLPSVEWNADLPQINVVPITDKRIAFCAY
jgi:hypothetical protein